MQNLRKRAQGTTTQRIWSAVHNFAFPEGVQDAKIAQVVGENQNFEGHKSAIQNLIFACRYMFSNLFAAILQKCASGSHGKHNFANCIFDANSRQVLCTIVLLPLARRLLMFFENHKISLMVVLGRPGGMRRGAGERFERGLRDSERLVLSIWHASACLRQGRRIQALRAFRRARLGPKTHYFGAFRNMWVSRQA